jgi:hypothetical protein
VKDRSGLVNVNKATVVKVATNLIVYPGLAFDEKLKLTAKLDMEATVFSVPFKNYIINIFKNQIETTIKHTNRGFKSMDDSITKIKI